MAFLNSERGKGRIDFTTMIFSPVNPLELRSLEMVPSLYVFPPNMGD